MNIVAFVLAIAAIVITLWPKRIDIAFCTFVLAWVVQLVWTSAHAYHVVVH